MKWSDTPKWVFKEHHGHVRKIKKPVRGNLPHAEGHSLRMVMTTTYECECGRKLRLALPKMKSLKCFRCGHRWFPRQRKCQMCPRCKSLLWQTPKR